MPLTFGKTTKGPNRACSIGGLINACRQTSPYADTIASISVYLEYHTGPCKIQCALYSASKIYIAATEEKTINPGQDDWVTFDFASPPSVSAGTNYYLCIWHEFQTCIYNDPGGTNQLCHMGREYTDTNWPAVISCAYEYDAETSMYATYSNMALVSKTRNILYDSLLLLSKTRNILYDSILGVSKTRDILYDSLLAVSKERNIIYDLTSQYFEWFKVWMEKATLHPLRKFTYDGEHETERVESFGVINRASDAIVSGGTSLTLINTDKHWNKFISDKSNLRRSAKLQLYIGVPNRIARSGIAIAGITASNLISLAPGSTTSSGIFISRNGKWLDVFTGYADDPNFFEAQVILPLRDKFAGLLEKELGSKESPLDYYSSAYNPADLTWELLTTRGGLDSTASTDNVDIDYFSWGNWKTACTTVNLSLKARFTGQTIREALELIRDLTNSDMYVGGEGKLKFFRFIQATAPEETYLFDEDRFTDFAVRIDSEKIINYLKVHYGLNQILELITNGDMEATNSWANRGTPSTNLRSNEQANSGTYSRKIVTDATGEGAEQNFPTIIGRWYRVEGHIYVSAGDAKLGKEDTDGSDQVLSSQASATEWKKFSVTFRATETTSRIFFQSDTVAASTFYVDDLSVKWEGPESWDGNYLKEDAASQQQPPDGYGLSSETVDGTIVWHATLASATSYADRRIQIFKDPLEVVSFTSFMMGMITEIGDIIRVTNAFSGYTTKYFRVHKITALNLANATISFEAADFKDITP